MIPYYNQQQIIKVNGPEGAKAYQMAPNSSALLLDINRPVVYLAQTDGGGYKSISAYNITPVEPEPEPDYKGIEERLKRLEALINESHITKNESATS